MGDLWTFVNCLLVVNAPDKGGASLLLDCSSTVWPGDKEELGISEICPGIVTEESGGLVNGTTHQRCPRPGSQDRANFPLFANHPLAINFEQLMQYHRGFIFIMSS